MAHLSRSLHPKRGPSTCFWGLAFLPLCSVSTPALFALTFSSRTSSGLRLALEVTDGSLRVRGPEKYRGSKPRLHALNFPAAFKIRVAHKKGATYGATCQTGPALHMARACMLLLADISSWIFSSFSSLEGNTFWSAGSSRLSRADLCC